MAFERSDQKFFIGGRSSSGLTNLLLFLLCIGVIVIILLMLFCPRWGCWRGTKVIGTDGRVYDGGGNVIINSACCDGGTPRTPGCPQCPPCDGQTCEEGCRQYSASPEKYKYCMERCNPPGTCTDRCENIYQTCQKGTTATTAYVNCAEQRRLCIQECNPPQTCEEGCRQYANYPDKYKVCLNECNPPQTCEDSCRQKYANAPTAMNQCLDQCNPPQTCQDSCRQKYPATTTAASTGYQSCVRQCYPTCQEYCRGTFSNDKLLMQRCFDQCNPTTTTTTPPDCRDSDGNNVNTVGEVRLGDQVYRDTCFDNMRVNEWICRDGKPFESRMTCPEDCVNGACVPRQKQPVCEDSDGNNVNVVGVIRYDGKTFTDKCQDESHVIEWTCRDNKPVQTTMTCAGRCLNGACIQQTSQILTVKTLS